jgi:hypothetical protein
MAKDQTRALIERAYALREVPVRQRMRILSSEGYKVAPSDIARAAHLSIAHFILHQDTSADPDEVVALVQATARKRGVDAAWAMAKHTDPVNSLRAGLGEGDAAGRFARIVVHRTVGEGMGAVYVFRYPASPGVLKIGSHAYASSVRVRVGEQVGPHSEWPEIALVIRSDRPQEMERRIHKALAGHRVTDAPGTEWYRTTIERVLAVA